MVTTTPTLWKELVQVNASDGVSWQVNGQIVPLANGGYTVVWLDNSGVHNPNGYGVVGQIYNALGNKVGGEVNLGLATTEGLFQPSVTVLSNGNIAVAFTVHPASNDDDIYVRIFDQALGFVRQDTIASGTDGTSNPSITALAGGAYAVSYTTIVSPTDYNLQVRIVDANGVVGVPFDAISAGDIDSQKLQRESELATLSNGNFVVVGQDDENGPMGYHQSVRLEIRDAAGALVLADRIVPGSISNEFRPDVAALSGGRFVVVWTNSGMDGAGLGISAMVFNDDGTRVNGGPMDVGIPVNTTTAGDQSDTTVAALADGGFVVIWEDEPAVFTRGQRFDAGGNKIGAEFVLNSRVTAGATEAPIRITLLADGRLAFVGNHLSGSDYDVVTSIWDPRTGPINGTAAADVLTSRLEGATVNGLAGNDTLLGMDGGDTLDGGAGADTMRGWGGADTYVVDDTGDVVDESFHLKAGHDTVLSSISFSLADTTRVIGAVELLTLTGTAAINGTGNALSNIITGNAAANILNGGLAHDLMRGGGGDDTYVVDNGLDEVDEIVAGSSGIDTVRSSVSFYLVGRALGVERLTLTGTADINCTGNSLPNLIIGNVGANVLAGGGGADALYGGAGNDTYFMEYGYDVVFDTAGIDTMMSTISRSLASYPTIEQLRLTWKAAINGTGNNLDNLIIGNEAANILNGGIGNDTLDGGLGWDKLDGGLGSDRLAGGLGDDRLGGGLGDDRLDGSLGSDWLAGGAGNDILIGHAGKDRLIGDLGNDIFKFQNRAHSDRRATDVITDFDDFGNDRIDVSALFGRPLSFIRDHRFSKAGQVRINDIRGPDVLVEVSIDRDQAPEFQIRLTGTALRSMTADDFFL